MQQRPILELPGIAAGAIAANRFVKYDMTQAGVGELAMGVADYAATTGKQLSIKVAGTSTIETGGAFAVGAELQSDAQGRAIVLAGGSRTGRALQASTGVGQTVEFLQIRS